MAQPGKKGWSYYPLVTLPRSLDIVWCRFPTAEMPSKPGPYPRPALVRSVFLNPDHTKAMVEVTYGTSNTKSDERPFDLILANAAEMAMMGLPQATRFDLDRTLRLPWAREFFEPRRDRPTPVIGHLTHSAIAQLEALKVARRFKGR